MKKVLIIKLGYSETLGSRPSLNISLGDVLRTTIILHFFKDDEVSWLVDRKAGPLLENNKYIKRIWVYNSSALNMLKKERFDMIVNLEKLPKVCQFSDSLKAREYFGFSKYSKNSKRLMELSQDLNKRKKNKDCWQKILTEALGRRWQGEPYILGYRPKPKISFDIGFNWTTSNEWTNKAWPKDYWHRLQDLIKERYSISWQQGLNSLYEYIDWINSCRFIITADSLGLHLSLALRKRVIALFGPTSPREIYFYNRGSFLMPQAPYKCLPCLKPYCDKGKLCIESITPEKVLEKIEEEFKNG